VQISCKDFHQKRALNMHIVDMNLFRLLNNDFQCTAFHESSADFGGTFKWPGALFGDMKYPNSGHVFQ
jgi:hypothetical protein